MVRTCFIVVSLLAAAATMPSAVAGVDVFAGAGTTCVAVGTDAVVDLAAPHCTGGSSDSTVPVHALILVVGVRIDGNDVCFLIDDNGNPSLSCTGPVCDAGGRDLCDISALGTFESIQA